jgi:putative transposase
VPAIAVVTASDYSAPRLAFCAPIGNQPRGMTIAATGFMPRKRRFAPGGLILHITNRGNDRRRLFFDDRDYAEFLRLLEFAKDRYPVQVMGICLMPNHFHALVRPMTDRALPLYLQWVESRYACELRTRSSTIGHGHVFQARYWSDPILDSWHFFQVLRYIEANALTGQLVSRAEDWPWGSLVLRNQSLDLLDPLPWHLPTDWPEFVNGSAPTVTAFEQMSRWRIPTDVNVAGSAT